VTAVTSPEASGAGIAAGDRIYTVAGRQVSTIVELNEVLKAYLPGQKVTVTLLNADGDLVDKKVTLSASSAE
jgi:serine protease Do